MNLDTIKDICDILSESEGEKEFSEKAEIIGRETLESYARDLKETIKTCEEMLMTINAATLASSTSTLTEKNDSTEPKTIGFGPKKTL